MKNISFIVNEDVSINHKELGVKSCSGTLSSTLRLICELKSEFNITVYHKHNHEVIDTVVYENLSKLEATVNEESIGIFVGAAGILIPKYSKLFYKSFYWLHNYERLNVLKKHIKNGTLEKIICVSSYQCFTMMKSGVFFDSTYINNIFEFETSISLAFSGALKKEKGLHNVIKVWRDLVDSGIDTHLHVFGDSLIYGKKNECVGISGVVDKIYEDSFSSLMTNEDGTIDKRIIFHGRKNKDEMLPIIKECNYFVSGLNETGAAECFSIAFLEAQSVNTPVLTLNRGGQPESLLISGSKSFPNIKALVKYIQHIEFKKNKLSGHMIKNEWLDIIQNKGMTLNKKRVNAIASGFYITFNKIKFGLSNGWQYFKKFLKTS